MRVVRSDPLPRQWIHLPSFDNEIEAAHAYDRKAVQLFGEYAWLNLPEQHNGPPERKKTVGT